jgi:hypothetical protein
MQSYFAIYTSQRPTPGNSLYAMLVYNWGVFRQVDGRTADDTA